MKLEPMGRGIRRPPLRTVTEIAEILGVTMQTLMWALRDADAPKPAMRSNQMSHTVVGRNRVWYEPKAVIRWYRTRTPAPPVTKSEKRRDYFREYYRTHYSVAAKQKGKNL